jgi:hypothetical protein
VFVQVAHIGHERLRVRQLLELGNRLAHPAIVEIDLFPLQISQHRLVMISKHRPRPPLTLEPRHKTHHVRAVRPAIDQIADKHWNATVGMGEVFVIAELLTKSNQGVVASVDVADDVVEFAAARQCGSLTEF